MKIAILLGGTSPERYVSMASGRGIALALAARGHEILLFDPARGSDARIALEDLELPGETAPSHQELAALANGGFIEAIFTIPQDVDIVVLALHGIPGEDGSVQGVLELRGLRYTGSGLLASALAMDKAMSKRIFEHNGVATPRWFTVEEEQASDIALRDRADRITGWPVVVKPNDGGSTVGLSIVEESGDIVAAVALAATYCTTVLVEEFIEGREVTVAILGNQSLPIVEIRPHSGIYDYTNKYTAGRTDYLCPAKLTRADEEELCELARRAHTALGCHAYSRVDFRIDTDGTPWCLEVNTLPGMTSTSLVPKAAQAAGIDYEELCERIVQLSLAEGLETFLDSADAD